MTAIKTPSSSTLLSPITATNRSIVSTFRKSETTFVVSPEERLEALPQPSCEGADTVVLHLGSRNTRIGMANQAIPKTVLSVMARKQAVGRHKVSVPCLDDHADTDFPVLGSGTNEDQVQGFNKSVRPNVIAEHDDALGLEWLYPEESYVVGIDATKISPNCGYRSWFPIHQRHLNVTAYYSFREAMDDAQDLVIRLCAQELGIAKSRTKEYCLTLVIPDTCCRMETKMWLEIGFGCGFKSVLIIHESLASVFGCGLGSACVVDIGSEQTSIALVEDGFILSDSKTCLDYGADHMNRLFLSQIRANEFPYKDLDVFEYQDFELLTRLRESLCTFGEMTLQPTEFHVRKPGEHTTVYQFKLGKEQCTLPMSLFHPEWLGLKHHDWNSIFGDDPERIVLERFGSWYNKKTLEAMNETELQDDVDMDDASSLNNYSNETATTEYGNEMIECRWMEEQPCNLGIETARKLIDHVMEEHLPSGFECRWLREQEMCGKKFDRVMAFTCHLMSHITGHTPPQQEAIKPSDRHEFRGVDVGILESIQRIESDPERVKKWLGSILLVGGGHLIPGFSQKLEERLRDKLGQQTPDYRVGVVTNARGIDPRIMCWKGACIGSRLEGYREFWITQKEWRTIGIRAFIDKFPYLFLQ